MTLLAALAGLGIAAGVWLVVTGARPLQPVNLIETLAKTSYYPAKIIFTGRGQPPRFPSLR